MNKQEAILKIKETLKSLMKFESDVVENTFAEVVTKDGIKIVYDGETLTTDTPVFKLDEAGNRIPCEDMEYVLEDGRTIVVTSGKVSEIKEETVVEDGGETPVEDANVEAKKSEDKMEVVEGEGMAPVVETEVEVEKPEEESNPMEMRIAELEAKVMKCMEMLYSLTNVSEEMSQKFEEFSKLPGESAIGTERKFERELTQEEIRVERLKQLKNSL